MPKITVLVTFYDRERYLEKCLESLKVQTFKDFKAILLDDGSTDGSRAIAQKFCDSDCRFMLLGDKHIGFPQIKNFGLDNVDTEYLIFLDSDDFVHPRWLEYLYKVARATDADISACAYHRFWPISEQDVLRRLMNNPRLTFSLHEWDKMNLLLYHGCCVFMWNKLFRTKLFDGLRFEDVIALSDLRICGELFERANYVTFIRSPLIFYRQHDESMGATTRAMGIEYYRYRFESFIKLYTPIWDKYPQTHARIREIFEAELRMASSHLGEDVAVPLAKMPFVDMVLKAKIDYPYVVI